MDKEVTKQVSNILYNAKCPIASFYVWIVIFMMIYFVAWMPEQTLEVDKNSKNVKVIKVDGKLRSVLVLSVIAGGIIGYYIVNQGCKSLGERSLWSIVWFLVALTVMGLVLQIGLAYAERIQLSTAGDVLRYLENTN